MNELFFLDVADCDQTRRCDATKTDQLPTPHAASPDPGIVPAQMSALIG